MERRRTPIDRARTIPSRKAIIGSDQRTGCWFTDHTAPWKEKIGQDSQDFSGVTG
jgi:hypothetical protein